jgi:hypothetical protein
MPRTSRFAAIAALLLGAAMPVDAQTTLTFNDLDCGFGEILESYRGFSFENTDCFDGSLDEELGSGFFTAGGGTQVIFGAFGDPFEMSSAAPFIVSQFRVASAWRANLSFTVEGFLQGNLVQQQMFVLTGPATAQTIVLNWMNIDRIRFTTAGGVLSTLEFDGTQAVIDDIQIGAVNSAVVPEPESIWLVAGGLLMLGARVKRRQPRGATPAA